MNRSASQGPLVVVGVDGSPQSASVLRWAVGEARARHGRVRAVHAWSPPQPATDLPFRVEAEISVAAERLVDAVVADAGDSDSGSSDSGNDVPVDTVVQEGSAVHLLLREAKGADLLVVGRHGDGQGGGTLIGSVAQTLVVSAPCPVLVVPLDGAGQD